MTLLMENNPIFDMLAEWEAGYRDGAEPTPAELCNEHPHCLEELRNRIDRRKRLLHQLQETTWGAGAKDKCLTVPDIGGYELEHVLGSGGMGVVYKARQIDLNRTVAIKMVMGCALSDLARFKGEAETVAKLHHPNIVQIHEIGDSEGKPYLALEYVDGGTLAAAIHGRPLSPQKAASLILELADAVHHAHRVEVVHRDLKPTNILMTQQGSPKIADFGLAKRLDIEMSHTQTGAVVGTPTYMAPEQAEGKIREIGPWTDIYSLGVILYEMLTGRVPFAGETLLETLEQVQSQDPVPPRDLVPKIPRDLELICLKCLEKPPALRYGSAADLAKDIQRFLDGDAVSAQPPSVVRQIAREVLRSNRAFPQYRDWSNKFLLSAPAPALIQLCLVLFCRHLPYYPSLALAVTFAVFTVMQMIVFRMTKEGFQYFPKRLTRQVHIVLNANLAAEIVALAAIWWHTPHDNPRLLLLVYPIWGMLISVVFFSFASEVGLFYVIGAVALLCAIPGFLFLDWAPLFVGLTFFANIGGQGLFYRWLANEIEDDKRHYAPHQ